MQKYIFLQWVINKCASVSKNAVQVACRVTNTAIFRCMSACINDSKNAKSAIATTKELQSQIDKTTPINASTLEKELSS